MFALNDITQLYSNIINTIYHFFHNAAVVNKIKNKMKNEMKNKMKDKMKNKMKNKKHVQQSYIAEDADC